ncbi:4-hydroxy-tetrahydrodipicolinate reductase [Salinisphaera sp. T31B1]|uniref:4-hydroxy-tetrahydrodipicolinate reductase n=1 Tax=Salinisphaera sp. T31B1 TaxID=727963 RepID=UPI00334266BC
MTRVAINGAAGRMGRELAVACLRRDDLSLAAAFEAPGSDSIGQDIGRLANGEDLGVAIASADDRGTAEFDVLIDFTRPGPCLAALADCQARGAAMVIGTTGFDENQLETIERAAEQIAIVIAPNFSAGVNLTLKLLDIAAKALGDDFDIEVVEAHHRHKVDAPSGTALRIGEVLADATGRDLSDCAVYARHGHTGERERRTIGFQTIRGGDIVGEHTVLFAGDGERVEITHKASSRQTFAGGAMRAAAWASDQGPGRYDMTDVLGLSDD